MLRTAPRRSSATASVPQLPHVTKHFPKPRKERAHTGPPPAELPTTSTGPWSRSSETPHSGQPRLLGTNAKTTEKKFQAPITFRPAFDPKITRARSLCLRRHTCRHVCDHVFRYMHRHMCKCVYTNKRIDMCIDMHIDNAIGPSACPYTRAYIRLPTWVDECMHECMDMRMDLSCVHMCVYKCV